MNEHTLTRHIPRTILLIPALALVVYTRAASCEVSEGASSSWYLGASLGGVAFVAPQRSASTISEAKTGGALELSAVQRPLRFLGIGCRGEFLFVPSREADAASTFGGRAMLLLKVLLPLGRAELHLDPEAGYSFLGREVDFENTDHVWFQGATVGFGLGVDMPIDDRFVLGGVVRVNQVLGTLACTDDRCHVPQKGRNPGPSLFVGVTGAFRR
jgi:hypothetical protein